MVVRRLCGFIWKMVCLGLIDRFWVFERFLRIKVSRVCFMLFLLLRDFF